MVRVFRYGHRFFPATEEDRKALAEADGFVEVEEYCIVPGSSIRKRHAMSPEEFQRKAALLQEAIQTFHDGMDPDTVAYYRRAYGPGFDEVLADYHLATRQLGPVCGSFHQQTEDDCEGCTFNVGTGGPEFGYGGGCVLTEVFNESPDAGFGRGDPNGHDPDHTPGKGTQTTHPPRSTRRQLAVVKKRFPGDTVYNNDLGADEPFGDEQGVHADPNLRGPNEGAAGIPIDPTHHSVESDDTQRKEDVPPMYKLLAGREHGQKLQGPGVLRRRKEREAGEVDGVFDTKEPASVGNLDGGVTMLPGGNR